MTTRAERTEPAGVGRVRQYGRTPAGNEVSIVIDAHKVGTADMYAMLDLAGRRVDRDVASGATGRLSTEED